MITGIKMREAFSLSHVHTIRHQPLKAPLVDLIGQERVDVFTSFRLLINCTRHETTIIILPCLYMSRHRRIKKDEKEKRKTNECL